MQIRSLQPAIFGRDIQLSENGGWSRGSSQNFLLRVTAARPTARGAVWSHASWRSRDTSHQLASASHIVGQGRLELPTSRLSGVRSNHLSYWPLPRGKRASCQTARRCPEASYTPLERKAHPGRTCARHRSPESPEQAERLNALGPWKLNRTYAAPARRWCQPGLRPALVVVTVVVLAAAEASAGTP
jgi:hypothetical protein